MLTTRCPRSCLRPIEPDKNIGRQKMLWTIFILLLVLWLLGVVSNYTLGGFIHLLLALAVLALIFQLFSDRHGVV